MRNLRVKILCLAMTLMAAASPLHAFCGEGMILCPGTISSAVLRNNHLLGVNDAGHIFVVDLIRAKTHDLGAAAERRWWGDVADGQVLLCTMDRLLAVDLATGKTVHEVEVAGNKVHAFGFAGKGQAFVHNGKTLDIIDLATTETLTTLDLGKDAWGRGRSTAWQKVGDLLYVVGVDSSLHAIDLTTRTIRERYSIESRAGIQAFRVEGDQVFCIGSPFSWGARIDHLTCVNLKTKKTKECELGSIRRLGAQLVGGTRDSFYLVDGKQVDRIDVAGKVIGTFAPNYGEGVQILGVWQHQAVVAMKGIIMLEYFDTTPVVRK